MPSDTLARIFATIPQILWIALVAFVFYGLRDALVPMLNRLANVEAFGVKLSISGGQAMTAAIEMGRKLGDPSLEVSAADRQRALDRASRERSLLEGAEILWVDDRPSNNRNEARMLRSFGALITFACTSDEALEAIRHAGEQTQPFHLVISDVRREFPVADERAGFAMLDRLRDEKSYLPVIFYVSRLETAALPPGAFGITNRPDQLLHLVLDSLARVRG